MGFMSSLILSRMHDAEEESAISRFMIGKEMMRAYGCMGTQCTYTIEKGQDLHAHLRMRLTSASR